jgi:DNA-binding transcriptional ArsR family regulator
MSISTLRDRVHPALVEFAWSQWAQMGVFANPGRRDRWAQDPEALLVFTLRVGRRDPRLFDEVLDWLRCNGRLVSGRRLATLCPPGDAEHPIVAAAVEWARAHGSPLRLGDRPLVTVAETPLFATMHVVKADTVFRGHGYLKPATDPSFNSVDPDLSVPVNLAFKLRQHFGLSSSRPEIVRFLLTCDAPDADALAIADAAGYAKRNVSETLAALLAAGDVRRYTQGNEGRYSLDRPRWADFLGLPVAALPVYRDWPRLLRALRELDRWLDMTGATDLSDYMQASEARTLMEHLAPTLTAAGVHVSHEGAGAGYWSTFEGNVARLLASLRPEPHPTGRANA